MKVQDRKMCTDVQNFYRELQVCIKRKKSKKQTNKKPQHIALCGIHGEKSLAVNELSLFTCCFNECPGSACGKLILKAASALGFSYSGPSWDHILIIFLK